MIGRLRVAVEFAAFVTCPLSVGVIHAQSAAVPGVIVGRVTSDSARAHGVENAEITIPELSVSVRTNAMGEFRLQVPRGRFAVTVRLPGFQALADSVTVSAAGDARLDFVLDQRVARLDSMVTRAEQKKYLSPNLTDFEERMRAHRGGYFVGDSVLRANESRRLPEVLASRVSGVRFFHPPTAGPDAMWAVGTRAAGHDECGVFFHCTRPDGTPVRHSSAFPDLCYSNVYVDGILIYDARKMTSVVPPDLAQINVATIAGVEFYASEASTPAQFTASPCGVLAIWIREK